jgi:DNA-binding SARP family transcriptional activator
VTSPELYLNLLGPFEARFADGRVADLRLKTTRLLLSWLVLRPRQSGSREEIAALLWSERDETQARQSLRQTIAVLRRALGAEGGEVLEVDRETLTFAPGAVQSDVALLLAVGADSPVDALERAVAWYRGEFLEGLSLRDPVGQQWLEARRAELRAMATRRFEWLLAAYDRAGRHQDAEPVASRLIEIDPLVEAGHRA